MQVSRDPRIVQVKKILLPIIGKKDLKFAKVMVTTDNTVVAIVYDTAIYTTKLLDIQPNLEIAFDYGDAMLREEDEFVNNIYLCDYIKRIYYNYQLFEANPDRYLVAYDEDVRRYEEFEKLLSLKADDGAEFYKLMGNNINQIYYLPIFAGFPSINKSDSIGLYVYDLQDGYFLNRMKIFKKKINREINIYYRTLNLDRR